MKTLRTIPNIAKINIWCLLTLSFIFLAGCGSNTEKSETAELEVEAQVVLEISQYVPADLPLGASQEDLARFAWNEFFALNWKASFDGTETSSRGTPDPNWSLSDGDPELAVWETYVHRQELYGNKDATTGYPKYFPKNPATNTDGIDINKHWNNLDEDNEISSCYLFAYSANEDPKMAKEVMYMAKTNMAEYTYLNGIRDDFNNRVNVINNLAPKLGKNPTPEQTLAHHASVQQYLENLTQDTFCDNDDLVCLPCGENIVGGVSGGAEEGAIEIKTAWRKLIDGKDDPSRFLIKDVVYYTGEEDKLTAHEDQFGLIGLHIIHKTKNYPSFIYASWEQVDVRQAKMQTIAYVPVFEGTVSNPGKEVEKPGTVADVVDRSIPIALQNVNKEAQDLIMRSNNNSAWQFYQLIGVQGTPIHFEDRSDENSYYMANYVIESDLALTKFAGSFFYPFDHDYKNVVYNGTPYTMGGCQGCHGAAHFSGTDFSFIAGGLTSKLSTDPYQTFTEAKAKADAQNSKKAQLGNKVAPEDAAKIKKYIAENE